MAKVIANRLKPILGQIFSPYQSAFVHGRLISNYIIVAFETLHSMTTTCKGNNRYIALKTLKLDMSKAYYRVEWMFLKAVLRKLGFPSKLVQQIMHYVCSVSFSVMVNGCPQLHLSHIGVLDKGTLSPLIFLSYVLRLSPVS